MKNVFKVLWEKFYDKIEYKLEQSKKHNFKQKKARIVGAFQSIGNGCKLNGSDWTFREPHKIIIGDNVHIGNNAFFAGEGGIIIGDNTHISRNVTVYTSNHDYLGDALPYDNKKKYSPVIIEQNVWIGMNVSIIPGVTIGEGAIIGIGTVVNRNIEPFEIVGSGEITSIKYRDENHYKKLQELKAYGGISGQLLDSKFVGLFEATYYDNRKEKIIFVLSTGRSGSKTIVDVLGQNLEIISFHESIRQLIRISTNVAEKPDNKEKILKELQSIFQYKKWEAKKGEVILHSDQRLWNLVPFLSSYFPNSKFIHLKRNPVDCITSMFVRDWYRKGEYPTYNNIDHANYRIQGDKVGFFSVDEWREKSPLQKCSWYWKYTNISIEKELKKIPQRFITLELENLEKSLPELCSFIGVTAFQFNFKKSNIRKKEDDKKFNKLDKNTIKNRIEKELQSLNEYSNFN